MNPSAHQQLELLLQEHPHLPLWGALQCASPVGLGWLHEHTEGRPVTLLISNVRAGTSSGGPTHTHASREFLDRDDVTVLGWRRPRSPRDRNAARGWFIASSPEDEIKAALLGAIELTRKDLIAGAQTFTTARPDELEALTSAVTVLISQGWDIQAELEQRLTHIDRKRELKQHARRTKPAAETECSNSLPPIEIQRPTEGTPAAVIAGALAQQLRIAHQERADALAALLQEQTAHQELLKRIALLSPRIKRRLGVPNE